MSMRAERVVPHHDIAQKSRYMLQSLRLFCSQETDGEAEREREREKKKTERQSH